jgi:hypothetical protein
MKPLLRRLLLCLAPILIAPLASGCASIASGTTQTLQITSNPDKASCNLERQGKVIGSVAATPGGVVVEKTKHDITVKCEKTGYQQSTGYLHSGVEGSTWGNIILGGGIGWAIDSARGADNHYPENITLTLVPAEGSSMAANCNPVQLEAIYMTEIEKKADMKTAEKLGRHEIIFGRYSDNFDMVLNGFVRSQFENQRNAAIGQTCSKSQHMDAVKRALPDADKTKFPESVADPALGPVDKKTATS